jgi:hypothetical protein
MEMKNNNIVYCILSEENEIAQYEKDIYTAFTVKTPDPWVANNYQVIDGNRFRSKIPYSDQKIYAAKKGDDIIASIAINFNCKKRLQLEEVGFVLYETKRNKNICEGLTLYTNQETAENFFDIFFNLGKFIVIDLKKLNISHLFSTCPKKVKTMYELFGFKIIDDIELYGKKEYLLEYDVENEKEIGGEE